MPRVNNFEKDFISKVKRCGFAVIKTENGSLMLLKEGFWGMVELKQHRNSKVADTKKKMILWANENSWGTFCYPENADEVYNQIKRLI